jgi:hypothetical protein
MYVEMDAGIKIQWGIGRQGTAWNGTVQIVVDLDGEGRVGQEAACMIRDE